MNRRQLAWFMALAMLTLLVAVSAPAFPQDAEGGDATEQQQDSTVESILQEQEQLLTGQRFAYDPDGRRDPFRRSQTRGDLLRHDALGPSDYLSRRPAVSSLDRLLEETAGRWRLAVRNGSRRLGCLWHDAARLV